MVFLTMEVYLELAYVPEVVTTWPMMRLCLTLEKMFRHSIPEWQVKQIENLCDIAINDENCFYMLEDTWLKMTISLKNPRKFFDKPLSRDELTKRITGDQKQKNMERAAAAGGTSNAAADVESAPDITIRRNVLPRQDYWKKLRLYHCSHSARGFCSRQILEESRREGKPLMEKLKEQRKSSKQHCELAIALQPKLDDRDAAPSNRVEGEQPKCPANCKPVFHAVKEVVRVRKLGTGAAGTVWLVVWGNCTYAMKEFEAEEGPFTKEYKYAESGRILHPNIVQAFGGSRPGEHPRPRLLMELLDGTLERFVYQSSTKTGPSLSRVEKLDVLLQVAKAMQKLHENNVVHGDLKLANILLSEFELSGDVRHLLAKVADFDGATDIEPSTSSVKPCGGTTEYAAPEVLEWRSKKSVIVNRKSDIYSFGVIAYEILTEDRAYDGIKLDSMDKKKEVWTGEKKLINCTAWRRFKNSRLNFKYLEEVISLVESCLELAPGERPDFSDVCDILTQSKSKVEKLERRNAARRKVFLRRSIIFVYFCVIVFMLFSFLHFLIRR